MKIKVSLDNYMLNLLVYFQSNDNDDDIMMKYKRYDALEVLEGIGNEQFKFQLTYNYFNDLNRLIHLFDKGDYSSTISGEINKIIHELFSCNLNEYLLGIAYIFGVYLRNNYFNNFINIDDLKFKDVGFDPTIINRIISYYSISYTDVRQSTIEQLSFYNKPFVKNKKGYTICPNIFNIYFLFGDCLYRLIADYYRDNKNDEFFSRFGNVFEKYFYDLFVDNALKGYIKKIKEDTLHKSPDYIFKINDKTIIFECKSTVSRITSTQRNPNMKDLFHFYKHINDSYEQINSYIISNNIKENVLKVLVEYTHDRDEGLLKTNSKISDDYFIIMNIVQVESICLLFNDDKKIFDNLIAKLFDINYLKSKHYSMLNIFVDLNIGVNNYYRNNRNYITYLAESLRPSKQ